MTFIFSDGRIVTHKTKSQGNAKNARPDQFLGYVSDQWANPCISGELITNAPQAIAQMGLLGVAAGMADGIAEAETQTSVTDQGTVIKNVVGDQLKFAGYKGVATGINDVRGWFKERMGQYFDVIYARAGQVVDIHITQEIKIDYDPNGRKVRYEKTDASDFGYMD
jgi:integrating conjugative element protein (TIGR03752 family)